MLPSSLASVDLPLLSGLSFFFAILGSIFLLNAVWWGASYWLAMFTGWRYLNLAFMLLQIGGLVWLIWGRLSGSGWDRLLPKVVVTALLLWHMLVLPVCVAVLVVALPISLAAITMSHVRKDRPVSETRESAISRREFVGFAAVVVPALATLGLTGIAMRQLSGFRVRRFRVPIDNLPPDLSGLTIVQVSDMHVGRYTSGKVLNDIVRVTNELRGDLVLLTGDLINDALADLDHGIELGRAMEARFGTYIIEGNHDLIENGPEFERRVKASGIPFLLDESEVITVRGTPVQLFGLSWTRTYQNRDAAITQAVNALLSQRQDDAFPILLAHHPHAFDAAAAAGIPLTLSGHTHGGQLMLNEQTGFGPAMFRYWSGLYTRGSSQLVVSNGVGNWFPLRVNAPAEIIHLTLVRS